MTPPRIAALVLPVVLTAAIAAGYLGAATALDAALVRTPGWWLPGVLALAQAVVLLARERLPLVVLAGVAAFDVVAMAVTVGEIGTTAFGVAVAVYTVVRRVSGRRRVGAVAFVAVAGLVVVGVAGQGSDEIPPGWALPFAAVRVALAVALPAAVAAVVSGREQLVAVLRERAEFAELDRERRAVEAVRRERTLMARELHDLAAHHLTGIVVSAQAADALLARDPERARGYLDAVQRDARTTLANLRQTVGLLRSDAEGELAPVPSIEQLPALVADAVAGGADVRLETSGPPVALGPLAGVAAYRMVQESLANAARHAPGAPVVVEVAATPERVRISVANAAPASTIDTPDEGYGLVGMKERAALLGATLVTGPTDEGGWRNTLDLPLEHTDPDPDAQETP